jgi:hypothetical protein
MAIKYTNILSSKALPNLPNLGFWFEKIPSGNPAPAAKESLELEYD